MITSYQAQRALDEEQETPQGASFAHIGTVHADGVTLVWEHGKPESRKHYKVNRSVVFHAGDYVRVLRESGTYIVEYPVGDPIFKLIADEATSAQTADTAQSAKYLISKDDAADKIQLTFNATKSTFAILSEKHTTIWRDFAQE